jgi:alkanesulfonate monooxygenase SsuD/methylene tetrahydromethanopterin reductase-like flavin-dependent oxidoreductase (luciferase family)
VILPTFRETPDEAYAVVGEAEALGVDGVFCYDHLWPMGQPERPALAPFPVLGAIAGFTTTVRLGTLVARVGLVPDEVLLAQFAALELLAPGRVVAGLGTGDHLSAPENEAYGIPVLPPDARRASLAFCARELAARGVPVWVGGGAPKTLAMAEAEGVAVNLWDAAPAAVAAQAQRSEVTWAGPAPSTGSDAERAARVGSLVGELAMAGATWVVLAWPAPLRALVESASQQPGGR